MDNTHESATEANKLSTFSTDCGLLLRTADYGLWTVSSGITGKWYLQ